MRASVASCSRRVGPRPADLVFYPTPACGSARRRSRGPTTPALSRPEARQDLHLNRAMLSDQWSPYVGRFARGWRRLPGKIPGQPQTRTRARSSIGRSPRAQENARAATTSITCEAPASSRASAQARRRGARGEHVVDEQHAPRHRARPRTTERAPHRSAALGRVALACGPVRPHAPEQAAHGQSRARAPARAPAPSPGRSRARPAAARERHPRHDVGRRRSAVVGHGAPRARRPTPRHPRELQPVDRAARRPLEQERRPRDVDRGRAGSRGSRRHGRARRGTRRTGRTTAAPAARGRRGTRSQNGHGPAPHPAHRGGNTTSSAALQHRPTLVGGYRHGAIAATAARSPAARSAPRAGRSPARAGSSAAG